MKLICKHEYEQALVPMYHIENYAVYLCQCRKCGKIKEKKVDIWNPKIIKIN